MAFDWRNFEVARDPDKVIPPGEGGGGNFEFKFPKFISPSLIIGAIFALIVLTGMFYTIQPDEVGVVLRFGKFIKNTNPGLHIKIPLGIEKVIPMKVEYIYKKEFGFRTRKAGVRTIYDERTSYDDESLMLTGDLNVLDLEWIVQYKIKDPFKVLFNIRDIDKTLQDLSESVMRKIVGDYTFNEVLTTKRMEINKVSKILNTISRL